MQYDETHLKQMPKRVLNNFINALSGFKSANLIGTVSEEGDLNVALFSSVFHVGANPPLMGFISRPHSVPRHTLENIKANGEFTISCVNEAIYQHAHHCSARSEKHESEFDFAALTACYKPGFKAPAVAESALKIYLKVREITPIKSNDTTMIVGEIITIDVAADAVQDDGFIDHQLLQTVAVSGLDSYHKTMPLQRLNYAKKDLKPSPLITDK